MKELKISYIKSRGEVMSLGLKEIILLHTVSGGRLEAILCAVPCIGLNLCMMFYLFLHGSGGKIFLATA